MSKPPSIRILRTASVNSDVVIGADVQPPEAEGIGRSESKDSAERPQDLRLLNHVVAHGAAETPKAGATMGKDERAPGAAVLWS